MRERNSRRTFLKVAAAVGGVQLSGIGIAQEEEVREIELGGRTSGWEGVYPDSIEGEENPTLELEEGAEYVVVWSSEDGQPHNFAIEDDEGENLVDTDIISSGSEEVEFTATGEMAEYYCEPHPVSMRGEIEIVESSPEQEEREEGEEPPDTEEDEEGEEEDGEEEEPEPDDDPSVGDDVDPDEDEPTETFELERTEEGWIGVSPDGIADEENPTLELENGEVYEISATTTIERDEHIPSPVLVVLDDEGLEIVHTDFLDEEVETQSVLFRADESIDGYFDQMELEVGGDIEVTGGNGTGDDEAGNGNETDDEAGNETDDEAGNETDDEAGNGNETDGGTDNGNETDGGTDNGNETDD